MFQQIEVKRRGLTVALTLSFLILTLFTLTVAYAAPIFLETDDWASPIVTMTDPGNSPLTGPGNDDAKGAAGQPANELITVYVDWDSTYIYVRWDVKYDAAKFKQVYLALVLDADDPFVAPNAATHYLFFEVDVDSVVTVTVRDAAKTILWGPFGGVDYYRVIPDTTTAKLEGKFAWSAVTGGSVEDIMLLQAESHATDPSGGTPSAVMDYIFYEGEPVPWFTDLPLAMLAVVSVVFLLRRKGHLKLPF